VIKKFVNRTVSVFIFVAVLPLSGCVAIWGAAHKVVSADENSINIQYDKTLTSSARASALAREHCKKFGKLSEPIEAKMPGILFGIIEESYACIQNAPVKISFK